MSDTFDHCSDAYNSLWDGYANVAEYDPTDFDDYTKDPLWYHNRWECKEVSRTEKAILMEDNPGQFWVPKKLVRYKGETVYIWEQFEPSYQCLEVELIEGEVLDL